MKIKRLYYKVQIFINFFHYSDDYNLLINTIYIIFFDLTPSISYFYIKLTCYYYKLLCSKVIFLDKLRFSKKILYLKYYTKIKKMNLIFFIS